MQAEITKQSKYIIFRLGDEYYATSIESIKEVVKIPRFKKVPYLNPVVKGVFNLRGQIVTVIDGRKLLNFEEQTDGLILIVQKNNELLGFIIDELISVSFFEEQNFTLNSAITTKINSEFIYGITSYNGLLIKRMKLIEFVFSKNYRLEFQKVKLSS